VKTTKLKVLSLAESDVQFRQGRNWQ
jgi:hypothetical protein